MRVPARGGAFVIARRRGAMLWPPATHGMCEASAKVAVWNRRALAVFWGLFGAACVLLPFSPSLSATRVFPFPIAIGITVLVSAYGFFQGWRWGRVAIGFVVAPLVVVSFDRLMSMHFQRYYGSLFAVCCLLLLVGFYTWVFIFAGLDRSGSPRRRRVDCEREDYRDEEGDYE